MKSWFVFPPSSLWSSQGFPVYFAKPVKPQHPSSRWSKVYKERSWNVEERRKKCEGKVCEQRSMSTYLSLFSGCSRSPSCPTTSLSVWQNFTSCSLPQTPPLSPTLSLSLSTWTHMWLSQQLKTALWQHLVVSEATTAKTTTIDRTDDKVTRKISSQRQKHA